MRWAWRVAALGRGHWRRSLTWESSFKRVLEKWGVNVWTAFN